MNCNANWHFSQKSFWSWLSRSIALYFYFFQCYTALKYTKKNLHLKCQPEGISRKLFFIIACGSIIVGNDVAQVTPSILYRQAVFIIRRVERRSKAFPHINFQLLVLCWNVLKLLSLGLGGKEKKRYAWLRGAWLQAAYSTDIAKVGCLACFAREKLLLCGLAWSPLKKEMKK